MQTDNHEHEAVLQNLKDAGCNLDIIARFMTFREAGKTKDSLRVLASQRATLLDEVHASQAKLDCLDYLIYKLRKER